MKKFTKIYENESNDINLNITNLQSDVSLDEQDTDSFDFSKDSKSKYNSDNLVSDLCTIMCLLNNNFLDVLLDGGNKARYTNNNHQFLLDLKTLMMNKNRLKFGKFDDTKCIEEDESLSFQYFDTTNFTLEKDWNKLVNARNVARCIIDKIIPSEKLDSDRIKCIYWTAPNVNKDFKADLVIETLDDMQYFIELNKSLKLTKSASFNTFADDLIGDEYQNLFGDDYIEKWNLLARNWVRIIYENAKSEYQIFIEKFINHDRIETLTWFDYINIEHSSEDYKHLGEYFKQLDKHYKSLPKLLSDIWKNRDKAFDNTDDIYFKWNKYKVQNLNSFILEHLFTTAMNKNSINDIKVGSGDYKDYFEADGNIKMKLVKTIVEKIGLMEHDNYYVNKTGTELEKLPNRQWFRDNHNSFKVYFDFHTKLLVDNIDDENNNFKIDIKLIHNNNVLIECCIKTIFNGGEMNEKLGAKYYFTLPSNLNKITYE